MKKGTKKLSIGRGTAREDITKKLMMEKRLEGKGTACVKIKIYNQDES